MCVSFRNHRVPLWPVSACCLARPWLMPTASASFQGTHNCCAQMKALSGSPYEWLRSMLEAFNHGDLHAYDALCSKHASALNAQPALVAHERKLREKITILCLMELIFKCALGLQWTWPVLSWGVEATGSICPDKRLSLSLCLTLSVAISDSTPVTCHTTAACQECCKFSLLPDLPNISTP